MTVVTVFGVLALAVTASVAALAVGLTVGEKRGRKLDGLDQAYRLMQPIAIGIILITMIVTQFMH